mmetsp:Transcript_49194/g.86585  ORF Transcript_49194/g.86585 Transcript_49194/m.86585 type:complete len:180 (+) Transcript_49194:114-653(+)
MGSSVSKCEGCCAQPKDKEAPMISVDQAAAFPGVSLKAPEFQEQPQEDQKGPQVQAPEPVIAEAEPEEVPVPEPGYRGLEEEQEDDNPAPGPSIQTITIERGGGRLGIDIDYGDGVTLLVKKVAEGGAAEKYNNEHPTMPLEEGDVILEINGAQGDTAPLLEKIQKDKVLKMTIRKKNC